MMIDNIERDRILQIVKPVRRFLEHTWHIGNYISRMPPSAGKCSDSSRLLLHVFRDYRPKWTCINGLYVIDPMTNERVRRGHVWIVNRRLDLLLDITADQFNDSPIILTNISDPRYSDSKITEPDYPSIYVQEWEAWRERCANIT